LNILTAKDDEGLGMADLDRKKLRVGVIGAGAWAVTSHLPALAARGDEVEFTAVCRKGRSELVRIADQFGFTQMSEDYRDVVNAGLDACIVASPAAYHYEHCLAALRSGAHVLIEKPMTLSSGDARELVDLADGSGRHLVVAFGWNYLPTFRTAKALLDEHGVGEVEHVVINMGSATRELFAGSSSDSSGNPDEPAETATWTDPQLSGGGYAQGQLSHAFGFLLGLCPLTPSTVYAIGGGPGRSEIELHVAAAIRFANGATGAVSGASFHSGAQSNRHQLEFRIFGSEGQMHVDLERDRIWLWRQDTGDHPIELAPGTGTYDCTGPVDALVDLALGRPVSNNSPGRLGLSTVLVLEALGRSMAEGVPVEVER
jgi:predicted dehydrogenase